MIEAAENASVPADKSLQIPAHRAILAGWSEMWKKLMTQGVAQGMCRDPVVRINGYPAQTVLQLLEFCYKGKTRVTLGGAIPLLAASRQFQVEELRKFCEDYCHHSMQATGVCTLHEQAKRYNCRRLAEATLQFVIENGDESLGSRDSAALSEESLLAVLQADDLVCDEHTVFECVVRWVKVRAKRDLGANAILQAQKDGEVTAAEVLEHERALFEPFRAHIRFPQMDPNVLRDVVVASGLVPAEYLMEALLAYAAPRRQIDSGSINERFRQVSKSACQLCSAACWLSADI